MTESPDARRRRVTVACREVAQAMIRFPKQQCGACGRAASSDQPRLDNDHGHALSGKGFRDERRRDACTDDGDVALVMASQTAIALFRTPRVSEPDRLARP